MHQAFYRKYRPQIFDDVCGQEHITSVLRYECETGNVSHAYLFCGSRGTGKTTCAKILAKSVNCEAPVNGNPCGKCASCRAIDDGSATDVVEMDAASNRGVDDIRILRDEVVYSPSMLKKRVYIIDEVHMLTREAFNALLKTLEEPPEYVVFILATTELHKLPATIISRCQRFDFRRITIEAICARLEYIAKEENIKLTHDAAARIARVAQGGMRDAINLFEICAGGGADVDVARVEQSLGLSAYDTLRRFALAVSEGELAALLSMIADTHASSQDIAVFWNDVASFWRDMMIMKTAADPATYLDLTETEYSALYDAAKAFSMNQIAYQVGVIDDALSNMSRAPQTRRQIAEFAVLRLVSPQFELSTDALLARISALEDKVALLEMGVTSAPPVAKQKKADVSETESTAPSVVSDEAVGASDPSDDIDEPVGFSDTPDAPDDDYVDIPDPSLIAEKVGLEVRSFVANSEIRINSAGDRIRVIVPNEFTKMMLENKDLSGKSAVEIIAQAAVIAKYASTIPTVEIVVQNDDSESSRMKFEF